MLLRICRQAISFCSSPAQTARFATVTSSVSRGLIIADRQPPTFPRTGDNLIRRRRSEVQLAAEPNHQFLAARPTAAAACFTNEKEFRRPRTKLVVPRTALLSTKL